VFASAFHAPLSLLGGVRCVSAHDPTATGIDDTFYFREDEVEEQERGEDAGSSLYFHRIAHLQLQAIGVLTLTGIRNNAP
jgi:hypothetical protein